MKNYTIVIPNFLCCRITVIGIENKPEHCISKTAGKYCLQLSCVEHLVILSI